MNTLKIASINTKDNSINRTGGIREDGTSNAEILADIIKKENLDLIGTQELTIEYVNALQRELNFKQNIYGQNELYTGKYQFTGSYRYGDLFLKMPYNENNNIIIKHQNEQDKEILEERTVWLPWIPDNFNDLKTSITKLSIMPRIATIVVLKDEIFGSLCMINTHLDYQLPSLQIRQLKALKQLILKYQQKYPVIVTGDFNMQPSDNHFQSFITDLKENNIKRVEINESTWYGKDVESKEVDHIFIPTDFLIEDAGIIDSKETSDHKFIHAHVRRKY